MDLRIDLFVVFVLASLVQENVCAKAEECEWCVLFSDAQPRCDCGHREGPGREWMACFAGECTNVDSYFVLPPTGNSVLVPVCLSRDLIFSS